MEVEVDWQYVVDGDEGLDLCQVLYAYTHPDTEEILYVGKADFSSVYKRLKGRHKDEIFNYLRSEFQISEMGLLVGQLILEEGRRFSSTLLSDVESLLIHELNPPANIQSTSSRISRPGLIVTCLGEWPLKDNQFEDAE
ncbi:GIY-YIG nuclease family protein [Sessilibacter sp. MAH4]